MGIGGLQQALQQAGHHVERIAPTSNRSKNLLLRRLWFNAQLPKLLQKIDFDLVVGFDIDGFLYSRLSHRLPFVASIKGVLAEEARQETGKWRWLLKSLSFLERHNAQQADLVISTSRYCQQAIERHYGIAESKIAIVPEGIDFSRWRRVVQNHPRTTDGHTILCVARQYRRKRIKDLLHALVIVRQAIPSVQAIIVGSGPEHTRLRQMITSLRLDDIVDMKGEIPSDDEVARLYRQADIFCLPSIQEGFGIAFLEAMANGLPIVATTAAAIPEVVPHGQAGLLVPPRNVNELAEALVVLLQDGETRQRMGDFGKKHVEQFDWPVVAEKFLGTINSLSVSLDKGMKIVK